MSNVGPTPLTHPERPLLCIVPALNEALTITAVLDDLHAECPYADVVVIDDGSTDATREVALSAGARVARMPFNVGIGGAVQTGLMWARDHDYAMAVQVDGDGQHVAAEIATLVETAQASGANVIIGSRFLDDTSGFKSTAARRSGMRVLAWLVSVLSGERFTDTTSGFRLYDRRAIEFLCTNYPEDYPEVEAILALRRAHFSVVEVQVTMRERGGGRSSITPLRSVYYMLKVTLALFVEMLRRKPKETPAQ